MDTILYFILCMLNNNELIILEYLSIYYISQHYSKVFSPQIGRVHYKNCTTLQNELVMIQASSSSPDFAGIC